MKPSDIDERAVNRPSPESFRGYLRANGWTISQVIAGGSTAWTKGDRRSSYAEVIVPDAKTDPHYELRMAEALSTVSTVDRISVPSLITQLATSGWDIVRFRLSGPEFSDGTVRLDTGAKLLKAASSGLLAAACSAVQTRAVHRGRKPRTAMDYLATVRMGQTELGSYVVALRTPALFPEELTRPPLAPELAPIPFERRATLTYARALARLRMASERDATLADWTPFAEAVGHGVNAELCDSVGQMLEQAGDGELELRFSWASGAPPLTGAVARVRFKRELAPTYREIARRLRDTEPARIGLVGGEVVNLHRDVGSAVGTATLDAVIDGVHRKVRVTLPPETYAAAIEAHRQERTVRFSGRVVRYGRRWFLEKPELVLGPVPLLPLGGGDHT